MNTISITGINVTNCSSHELNRYICQVVAEGRKELIPNVNIHCLNLAWRHKWLRDLLNSCAVVFCDGEGVRLAAWMVGRRIDEKITYNRWIWDFAQVSATEGLSWYILGSAADVIGEAARRLRQVAPALLIVGYRSGYWDSEETCEQIVADINRAAPHVLIVGMGMPLQEAWLRERFNSMNVNVALTGGAVWDYVSGNVPMTPRFVYIMKLEWLFRLLHEPRRLWRRYLIGIPLFIYRVIAFHICNVQPPTNCATEATAK